MDCRFGPVPATNASRDCRTRRPDGGTSDECSCGYSQPGGLRRDCGWWLTGVPGTMLAMPPLPAQDRTVYVTIGPSAGRPDFERVAALSAALFTVSDRDLGGPGSVVRLVADSISYPRLARDALLGAVGRWVVHWVIFRGGWSVYIDAPDRDPIKVRCANRGGALARMDQLAAEIEAHGVEIVDELRR